MKNKEIKSNENKHKVLRYKKKAKGVIYNKVFGWFLKLNFNSLILSKKYFEFQNFKY